MVASGGTVAFNRHLAFEFGHHRGRLGDEIGHRARVPKFFSLLSASLDELAMTLRCHDTSKAPKAIMTKVGI